MTDARMFLAEVLRISPDEMPEDPSPDNVEDWDSLAHSEIIMALEDKIGRELDAAEIAAIESIQDIQSILDKAEASR